jgi:hypothetical protein
VDCLQVILVFLLWVTLLIVERIAYLNGHIQFKLMLHYATVLLGHWFVFFESPLNSLNPLHTFRSSGYLQVLYLLLLLYYTLSALQIRHGYLQGAQYGIAAMKLGTVRVLPLATAEVLRLPSQSAACAECFTLACAQHELASCLRAGPGARLCHLRMQQSGTKSLRERSV